jgi:hypothetical protein
MEKKYKIRYGGDFDFKVESSNTLAETATFYVGKVGETPVITVPATFVDGEAFISTEPGQTEVPLGEYKWQLTIELSNGRKFKYPVDKDGCALEGDDLPDFEIVEALDETEVE